MPNTIGSSVFVVVFDFLVCEKVFKFQMGLCFLILCLFNVISYLYNNIKLFKIEKQHICFSPGVFNVLQLTSSPDSEKQVLKTLFHLF